MQIFDDLDEAVDEEDLVVEGCALDGVPELVLSVLSEQVQFPAALDPVEVAGQGGQPVLQEGLDVVFQWHLVLHHHVVQPFV